MTNYTRRALGKAILDMGSIPIASTKRVLDEHLLFQRRFRRQGDALIRNRNRHLRLISKVAVLLHYKLALIKTP